MKKIVCTSSILNAKEIFSRLGEVTVVDDKAVTNDLLADKDALITRTQTKITPALLTNTSISFVGTATSGSDHVDKYFLDANNITFSDAKGSNANAVAEHVLLSILCWITDKHKSLEALTIGIIGYGFVGKQLAILLRQLKAKVIISDQPLYDNGQLQAHVNLNTLARCADIISLHVPLHREGVYQTVDMIGQDFFNECVKKPLIINTARGDCVDYDALLGALKKQQMADFIADVWPNEPQIKKIYIDAAYLATPHIAGHTIEAKLKGSYQVYQALCKAWHMAPTINWQDQDIIKYNPDLPRPRQTSENRLQTLLNRYNIKQLSIQMKKLMSDPKDFNHRYQDLREVAGRRHEFRLL